MIINENKKLNEGNGVSSNIPALLDNFLQDVAQMTGQISYNDIIKLGKDKKLSSKLDKIKKLKKSWGDVADDDNYDAMMDIGRKVKSIINESVKMKTYDFRCRKCKHEFKDEYDAVLPKDCNAAVRCPKCNDISYIIGSGADKVVNSSSYKKLYAKSLKESTYISEAISEEVNKNDWVVVNIAPRLNDRVALVPVQIQSVSKYRVVGWAWNEALHEYSAGAIVYKAKNEKDALNFITDNEKKYVKDLVNKTNESLDEAVAPKGMKVFLLLSVDSESGMSEDDIDNGIFKFYAKDEKEAKELRDEWCRRNGYNKRSFFVEEDKPHFTAYKKLKTVDITSSR